MIARLKELFKTKEHNPLIGGYLVPMSSNKIPPPPTIKLPTSTAPPTLPPNLLPPGRNNILNIIREQAESICIAGRDRDGHEERVVAMEQRLARIVAMCFASYDNKPSLVVDVCEHGCAITPDWGFVPECGCPIHDSEVGADS